jgi:uncharacterized membrane protein (DUF373 family)
MAKADARTMSRTIKATYNNTIDVVFAIILVFISLTMVIGAAWLFCGVEELWQKGGVTGSYLYIFSDVLTLYILIELSRSLMEYFSSHRVSMTPIINAGIVFVLRHIMIGLFEHQLGTPTTYALSVLLVAMIAVQAGSSLGSRFGAGDAENGGLARHNAST